MSKKKFTPCSVYNTEMLECWLDEMAAEGLLLEHEGYRNTYANFAESEKKKAFHRIWPKDSLNEYREAHDLRESYGWEFVASFSDFEIYRTFDDTALRIDGNEKNDFYCKKASRKRFIWQILQILLSVAVFSLILFISPYIIVSEYDGLFLAAEMLIVFALEIIKGARNIRMIQKIKSRKENKFSGENTDWKKETLLHQIPNILSAVILIIFFFMLMWTKFDVPIATPLPEDTSNFPFATVIDFTEDKSSYTLQKSILNVYEKWETPVSKANYDWGESAKIKADDGSEITCKMTADYHETIHPFLAKTVAKLYVLGEKVNPYKSNGLSDSPSLGIDYEMICHRGATDKAYVLQHGNKVIHFTVYCSAELPEGFDKDEFDKKCLEIMAESIK